MGTQGIYSLLNTSAASVLNSTARRAPDGVHLVEILQSKQGSEGLRSGSVVIIEFRVLSSKTNTGVDVSGQTFSSVPKPDKAPEATTRELAAFVAACEGRQLASFVDSLGRYDGAALAALIKRAFETNDAAGQPLNPYKGCRVMLRTEEKKAKGSGFPFTRHEWTPADPTLCAQAGLSWPVGNAPAVPSVAAPAVPGPYTVPPAAPQLPYHPQAALMGQGYVPNMAPPAPPPAPPAPAFMAPPAPVMPPSVAAPPAPPPAPPAPAVPSAPAMNLPPGWKASAKFAGWAYSGPSEENPGTYWNPSTNQTTQG